VGVSLNPKLHFESIIKYLPFLELYNCFFFFLWYWWVPSLVLARQDWATPLAFLFVFCFWNSVLLTWPRLAKNSQSSCLCFPSSWGKMHALPCSAWISKILITAVLYMSYWNSDLYYLPLSVTGGVLVVAKV
jgi:hypothetical protein